MKSKRWFAPLFVLSLSPLLAHADEVFDDPSTARQLTDQLANLEQRKEAGSVRVNLQGTPLTFLAVGPDRLVVFRPAGKCFDALRVTVKDGKVILGEVLPEVHFCTQNAIEHVDANAFVPMNRFVLRLPDQHDRAGIRVAWTHLLSFDATSGKKIASTDVESQVSAAFPSGSGFLYTTIGASGLRAWPDDERFPAAGATWTVVSGHRDWGYGLGSDAPFLFLQSGPRKLGIVDLRSRALWTFDSTFGGAVDQSWNSLNPVRTGAGLAFAASTRTGSDLYTLALTPGATPVKLGTVPFLPARITTNGDALFLTSNHFSWWEPLLSLMQLNDQHVDRVMAHAADAEPPPDATFAPYSSQVPGLPSQVWEATADASGKAAVESHCYALPPDWKPAATDAATPLSVAGDPLVRPCTDDWKAALQHVAQLKQQPFERAQTPQQAATFCIGALARQRSKELLRCVDLEALIAAQGGRDAALMAALIGAVSPNAKLDPSQLDALAEEEAAGPLANATRDVRYEVLQYLVTHETLPPAKLRAVSEKHFFADWRFEGEHPFTLTMGFGHSPVGKRKRLSWVLTDTSYTDEHGEVFPGLVAGKLPGRMF